MTIFRGTLAGLGLLLVAWALAAGGLLSPRVVDTAFDLCVVGAVVGLAVVVWRR